MKQKIEGGKKYIENPIGKCLSIPIIKIDKNGTEWLWTNTYDYEVIDGKRTGWATYRNAKKERNWTKYLEKENLKMISKIINTK